MSEGDFNEGWSRKKNLAYDLGCDLSGLVGLLELLSEPSRALGKKSKATIRYCLRRESTRNANIHGTLRNHLHGRTETAHPRQEEKTGPLMM